MKFQTARAEEPEINLTALIDVVFLLLIFFMVSTTFDTERVRPVVLPDSLQGEQQKDAAAFEIMLAPGGRVETGQWTGQMNDPQLSALLARWGALQDSGAVIIYADHRVSHGDVVRLMDLVARADIQSVQLATRYN